MRPVIAPRSRRLAGARPRALGLVAAALLVGACTAAAPGWTFEPPPSATPVPSVAASGAEPSASTAASTAASPSAASSGGTGGGPVLAVKALNIAFDVSSLTAPANTGFQIAFDNEDQSTQHDVAIKDSSGAIKWQGDLITGIAQTTYNVPALPAGSYTFFCIVHPSMTGTLDVH